MGSNDSVASAGASSTRVQTIVDMVVFIVSPQPDARENVVSVSR